jgi:ribonuclease P protein component
LVKRLDGVSMRPHHDYVLVGRRAALHRDFSTMLDDLRQALLRLDRQPAGTVAFSSEVVAGSRQANASKRKAAGASRNPN